ncbi:MAG: FAD-dependent monooxygenase [Verrucomicrobiales bacterium]|nr:FAD-dependent monooxygenase [Verrucomicrobiales bacterium]
MTEGGPIQIAGGGLAGLSLALSLRSAGIPVQVTEAGQYPRHRVCGEFLSGRGLEILGNLGILAQCQAAGARMASTVCFATPRQLGVVRPLPEPALCLSRHRLDALLASEVASRGGVLRTGIRVATGTLGAGWVRATGRRIATPGAACRWFGIKAHATGVPLSADLEMHFSPGAYVGLCRLDADRVNVCGLFRRRPGEPESMAGSILDRLRGPAHTLLRTRLQDAHFDPASVCSVGGLDLRLPGVHSQGELVLGDAIAMIPPLTGNGMSLALESSDLATGPLADFARGRRHWIDACREVQRRHHEAFSRRLRIAGLLQRLLFLPVVPSLLFRAIPNDGFLWRALFAATRA